MRTSVPRSKQLDLRGIVELLLIIAPGTMSALGGIMAALPAFAVPRNKKKGICHAISCTRVGTRSSPDCGMRRRRRGWRRRAACNDTTRYDDARRDEPHLARQ